MITEELTKRIDKLEAREVAFVLLIQSLTARIEQLESPPVERLRDKQLEKLSALFLTR